MTISICALEDAACGYQIEAAVGVGRDVMDHYVSDDVAGPVLPEPILENPLLRVLFTGPSLSAFGRGGSLAVMILMVPAYRKLPASSFLSAIYETFDCETKWLPSVKTPTKAVVRKAIAGAIYAWKQQV